MWLVIWARSRVWIDLETIFRSCANLNNWKPGISYQFIISLIILGTGFSFFRKHYLFDSRVFTPHRIHLWFAFDMFMFRIVRSWTYEGVDVILHYLFIENITFFVYLLPWFSEGAFRWFSLRKELGVLRFVILIRGRKSFSFIILLIEFFLLCITKTPTSFIFISCRI